VYTYLDDFGAWCASWAARFFSKPEGEPAHATHVPARPASEPVPAERPAAGPAVVPGFGAAEPAPGMSATDG
jgi:hypothetical protein